MFRPGSVLENWIVCLREMTWAHEERLFSDEGSRYFNTSCFEKHEPSPLSLAGNGDLQIQLESLILAQNER